MDCVHNPGSGAAILAERMEFTGEQTPASDCAPLTHLAEKLEPFYGDIRAMRDPTRGGLATTLIELAAAGGVDLHLEEKDIPVNPQVSAVADILGVDPYYLASEGRALMIVAAEAGGEILKALKTFSGAQDSAIIGTVREGSGSVYLRTRLGGPGA